MDVLTRNMAHRAAGWKALLATGPDVAILNEARVANDVDGLRVLGGAKTEGKDAYKRPWATAIASRHEVGEIVDARAHRYGRPIRAPFETSRPGSWTAALVTIPDFGDVTVASLYRLLDEKSDASVHRSLSELTPLFEDRRYNRMLLVGGDLNTWTGWGDGSEHLARDVSVLQRIEALGLVDCLRQCRPPGRLAGCPCSDEPCGHTRTRRDPRYPNVPYQDDYLFASPKMAERLRTCTALDESPWASISDHLPIVASFD
jgi:endonuclease/exonuclease/phosphatase family metal-dependent hydrolase